MMIVYDSSDAFFEGCGTEVDQQPQAKIKQPQVSQQLFCMHRSEIFNRLQFYNKTTFNEQVDAQAFIEM